MRQSRVSLASACLQHAATPPNPQAIKLAAHSWQTGFDISQAKGQLSKGHHHKLIQTRKTLDVAMTLVTFHTTLKGVQGRRAIGCESTKWPTWDILPLNWNVHALDSQPSGATGNCLGAAGVQMVQYPQGPSRDWTPAGKN